MYKTEQVSDWFMRSPQTIRSWSEQFEDYLSPGANPGTGVHRKFTLDDLQIFALVAEKKQLGRPFSQIHEALQNGERGEVPTQVYETDDTRLAIQKDLIQQQIVMLQTERNEARAETEALKLNVARLEGQLEVISAEADKRVQKATVEADAARDELRKLEREIGRLQARLELIQNDE